VGKALECGGVGWFKMTVYVCVLRPLFARHEKTALQASRPMQDLEVAHVFVGVETHVLVIAGVFLRKWEIQAG